MSSRYINTAFTYAQEGAAKDPGDQGQILKR